MNMHVMWQSWKEIECYFVACFKLITKLDVLQHLVSAEGGAHMQFIDVSGIHAFTHRVWALALVEAQRNKLSDVVEICDGITFNSSS